MAATKDNYPLLEKNDFIEADIIDYGYEGEGVAKAEGVPVFIKQAIKGERVRAKIIFAKKDFCFGIIDKIMLPSTNRTKPPCPFYGKCGGCDIQHMSYAHQLEFKRESLRNTLKKQLKNEFFVDETVASDKQYSYRNKLSLPVRGKDCSVGFFAKNSHRLVKIDDCLLQSFDAKRLIELFSSFTQQNNISGYEEGAQNVSEKAIIRHLVVRELDGVLVISIVTNKPLEAKLRLFDAILKKEYADSYVLYNNINDKTTNVIFGNEYIFIGGNNEKLMFNNTKITAHPAAFFQVNNQVANQIYNDVIAEVKSTTKAVTNGQNNASFTVIDAYSGAGYLSLKLAEFTKKVYAIEINKEASQAARILASDNGKSNIECIQGDCAAELIKVCQKLKSESKIVILDPPKKGCDKEVIKALKETKADKLIYISCNPATLGRDLAALEPEYKIKRITPYDMFPQTANLETLTILEPKN